MRWIFVAAVAALFLTTTGCDRPRSQVHGTVTYQGTPVAGGTIIFLGADNRAYPTRIGSDGTYVASGVPHGDLHVSVLAADPQQAARPNPGARDSDAFAKAAMNADDQSKGGRSPTPTGTSGQLLPAKYNDPTKSELSFELTQSDQEYTVDLK